MVSAESLVLGGVLTPPPASGLGGLPSRRAAVVLADGLIAGVNAAEAPMAQRVRAVDLDGCCVLPGFVDAHTHLEWAAEDFWTVRWEDVASHDEVLRRVRLVSDRIRSGFWIFGGGWTPERLTDAELPSLAELDAVTGDLPLLLRSVDQSMALLNSAAMRLCRIEAGSANAEEPGVECDERGAPTGRLRGPAVWGRLAFGVPPPRDAGRRLAELRSVLHDMTARGVTEIHDIATYPRQCSTSMIDDERSFTDLRLVDALQAAGGLPLRVGYRPSLSRVGEHRELTGMHEDDPVVFFTGYKMFVDDGWDEGSGDRRHDEFRYPGREATIELVREADRHGAPVSLHAIGDLGVAEALDILAAAAHRRGSGLRPHRLVHARRIRGSDIRRCAELGVVIETQPWEITAENPPTAGRSLASPYREMLRTRVNIAFGSDRRLGGRADGLDADPLMAVQLAVTRRWRGQDYQPDQRLTVGEALFCATRSGAAAAAHRPSRGLIVPGSAADLVIIDRDPWTTEPERIAEINVVATISAGRVVADSEGAFSAG